MINLFSEALIDEAIRLLPKTFKEKDFNAAPKAVS